MKKYITHHFMKGIMLSLVLILLSLLSFIGIKSLGSNENKNDENVEAEKINLTAETVNKTNAVLTPSGDSYGTGYNSYLSYWDYTTSNPGVEGFTLGANEIILTTYRSRRYGWHVGSTVSNISIPETYDGKTVVGIWSNFNGAHYCDHYWGSDDHWVSTNFNYVKLPKTIRYIGANAFVNTSWGGATSSTKYDLSACNNLEYIGANAFGGDSDRGEILAINKDQSKLTFIGDKAFKNAWIHYYEENETIIAPILKKIGDEAFLGCTGLKKLNLDTNTVLQTIGTAAFKGCTNIETMNISGTVTDIGKEAFMNTTLTSVSMASDVLSESIFEGCSSLTQINAPDNVFTKVPARAFFGCQEFTTDTIFTQITEIGDYAFYHVGFSEFNLPSMCTKIGNYAFGNNKESLRSIDLKNVQTIGNYAFFECQQLTDVVIPATVSSVGTNVFKDCTELISVEFKVNKLNEHMFDGCTALKTVKFLNDGSDITTVPAYCFNDCSNLSTLSIITTESATLTTIGAYAFNNTAFPSISLTTNQNTVGRNAFSNMASLYSVTLDVTNVSVQMFYNCQNLNNVTIGSNVTTFEGVADALDADKVYKNTTNGQELDWIKCGAFQNCSSLVKVTIQNAVIGDYMFDRCTSLVSVTIPASVTTIGEHAFSNCTKLTTVTLSNTVLGRAMFENDEKLEQIVLSSSLTTIPYRAFYKSYLTSITIPSSVIAVEDEAFAESTKLASITLNNAVIGNKMFAGCTSLTTVKIPACEAENVGSYAFKDCTGITTIDITDATTIGIGMFIGCEKLGTSSTYVLTIPSSVTSIGKEAFKDCTALYSVINNSTIYSQEMFKGCNTLHAITINENVTTVGTNVFENCTALGTATINNYVTNNYMFLGCSALTTVSFNPVTKYDSNSNKVLMSISEGMFKNCAALHSIAIDYGYINQIGTNAFQNCTALESLTINAGVTTIGEGIFNGCSKLKDISIPFVGSGRCTNATQTATAESTFGYLFGTTTPVAAELSKFNLIDFQYSDTGTYSAYLPKSLNSVDITDETVIQRGAFSNLTCGKEIIFGLKENANQAIQTKAFYNADSMTSFTLNANIKTIGSYAFAECGGLVSIVAECDLLGDYIFQNCTKLESATISYISSINQYAFDGCVMLQTLLIDTNNLTYINAYAFRNCELLGSLTLPQTVRTIGTSAFEGCTNIRFHADGATTSFLPSALETIGAKAFYQCDSLINVVIPEDVTSIDANAFAECNLLEMVKFNTNAIGSFIFYNDTNLKYVYLKQQTSIPESAFEKCSGLEEISIPTTVTQLGNNAFRNSGLVNVTIPANVTTVGSQVFANNSNLVNVVFNNSKMGVQMFLNDTNLVKVNLNTVDAIPDEAFNGCTSLENNLYIPNTVLSIGKFAFRSCTNITEITIPNSVKTMGLGAFLFVDMKKITLPFVGEAQDHLTTRTGEELFRDGDNVKIFYASDDIVSSYGAYWTNHMIYNSTNIGYIFSAGDKGDIASNNRPSTSIAATSKTYEVKVGHNLEGWNGYSYCYIPNSLIEVNVTNDTVLGGFAFYGARGIKRITISNATQTICGHVFYGCNALEELSVPFIGRSDGANEQFKEHRQKSTSYTDQYQHSSLLTSWFYYYTSWYDIPSNYYTSDTTVVNQTASNGSSYAGYIPNSLHTIRVTNSTTLGVGALSNLANVNTITLPDNLTTIGNNAFTTTAITSLTIPQNVASMGTTICKNCTKLESVVVNNSLVQTEMFTGCTKLSDVIFNGANTSIAASAFSGCIKLVNVYLPANVISVDNKAFENCTGIETFETYVTGSSTTGQASTFIYMFGESSTGLFSETNYYAITDDDNYTVTSSFTRYIPKGKNNEGIEIIIHGVINPYAYANLQNNYHHQ